MIQGKKKSFIFACVFRGDHSLVVAQIRPFAIEIDIAWLEGVKALYFRVSTTLLQQVLYLPTQMELYEYL